MASESAPPKTNKPPIVEEAYPEIYVTSKSQGSITHPGRSQFGKRKPYRISNKSALKINHPIDVAYFRGKTQLFKTAVKPGKNLVVTENLIDAEGKAIYAKNEKGRIAAAKQRAASIKIQEAKAAAAV